MGIRNTIKKQIKSILKRAINRVVETDLSNAGVPPDSSMVKENVVANDKDVSIENPKESAKETNPVENQVSVKVVEAIDAKENQQRQESNLEEDKEMTETLIVAADVAAEVDVVAEAGIQEHAVSDTLKNDLSEEEKKEQAAVKHMAKTKKGLIKKIMSQDGSMNLTDLHTYSEARYFVGHKRFSDLMEELIAEELVSYTYEDGIVSLGVNAQTFLS
jgi:hypothetical protein